MTSLVDIDGFVIHATDKAWLFRWDADQEPTWIPKSVGEIYVGGTQTDDPPLDKMVQMTLPEKWAEEKGML